MWLLARDIVSQPDGCHGDETIVHRVQVVPLVLEEHEDSGWDEEHEGEADDDHDGQMQEADVERLVEMT